MTNGPRWVRPAAVAAALAIWVPATAFFAIIGWRVASGLASGQPGLVSRIVDLHGALVTVAYSLGGAVVGLGLVWLALPADRARGLRSAAALWLGITTMLVVTREVSGVPLLIAAIAALGIGLDVIRRLVLTAVGR